MAVTITLDDKLAAGLETRAKKQQLSVEQFAISILTVAMIDPEFDTPREAVARTQATARSLSQVRAATADLGQVLRATTDESCFDLESWQRQWSDVETEMKAITRTNDIA